MSKQSEEVRLWLAGNGIKNKDCAERLGTSIPNISNYLAGRRAFSKKLAAKMAEAYGFDIHFLITGEGSLFPPTQSVGNGAIVNGGRVSGGINVTATNAALQAENERLRNEVEWLREQLAKK